jgi:hypothetical protein
MLIKCAFVGQKTLIVIFSVKNGQVYHRDNDDCDGSGAPGGDYYYYYYY